MGWDRKKLPTPESHVYSENGAEIMVYNMKRHSEKRMGGGEEKEKRGGINITRKRKNSERLIMLLGLNRGCFLYFGICNSSS